MSLPSICQIICLERRRVELTIKRRTERATILFENGEIVHASIGKLEGEEAVYHLLAWTEGNFRAATDTEIPRRTIAMRWDQLMMEGMKRLDELERDRAAQAAAPAAARALTAAEIEYDAHLENEMILLMSQLDHLRARLSERNTQKRPAQALQILSGMANQVVELAEGILRDERRGASLNEAIERATSSFPSAQGLKVAGNRLSAESIAALYLNASNPNRRQQVFKDVSRSIISVIDEYFAQLTACFRSESATDELREAYGFFFTDLTKVVGGVKT
jgi:hypothetical protein